jgi:hypothetical protein
MQLATCLQPLQRVILHKGGMGQAQQGKTACLRGCRQLHGQRIVFLEECASCQG